LGGPYSSRYRYEFDRYERKIFETFISAETTFSRDLGPFSSISARARSAFLLFYKKNAAAGYIAPPKTHNGGAVVLKLRARLNPAHIPRGTPVREVLSPRLRAHESFWERRRYEMREPPRGLPFFVFSDWKKNALLFIGRPRKT